MDELTIDELVRAVRDAHNAAEQGSRAWRRHRAQAIRAAVDNGAPIARLARELDVSRPTIYAWLREGTP